MLNYHPVMTSPAEIAKWLGNYSASGNEGEAQAALRQALSRPWKISPGERVLEVGCGQGDTTAILADLVGSRGRVTALDPADGSYGEPQTLEESQAVLLASPVGSRIEFHNDFDLLKDYNKLESLNFDAAVMANCSWYFASKEEISETFILLKKIAKRLCFSEWDLEVKQTNQIAHATAVSVQNLCHKHKLTSDGNIRTPLLKEELTDLIRSAGWKIQKIEPVRPKKTSDHLWEFNTSDALGNVIYSTKALSEADYELLTDQHEFLMKFKGGEMQSLDCFSLVAV